MMLMRDLALTARVDAMVLVNRMMNCKEVKQSQWLQRTQIRCKTALVEMPNISLSLTNERLETMCDQELEPHNSETNISKQHLASEFNGNENSICTHYMEISTAVQLYSTGTRETEKNTQLSSLVLHTDFCNPIDHHHDADCLNMQFSQNIILEVKWKIDSIFMIL